MFNLLVAKFRFISWLVDWVVTQGTFSFEWDSGNETKSFQKHGITRGDAESVFDQPEAIRALGEQVAPEAAEPRYGLIGVTMSGKRVFVCFTMRPSGIRVISIREMNRKERYEYAKLCEKQTRLH